jgi:hypothetical protein
MLTPADFPFASEFHVVAKSVEVVVKINGQAERVRIDALDQSGTFTTKAYIEIAFMLQRAYPKDSDGMPEEVRLWVDYDLPWVSRNSADAALAQALSFLGEVCKESGSP